MKSIIFIATFLLAVSYCSTATQNDKPKENVKFLVFTEQCFDTFFLKNNFVNLACIKMTISKLIGISIVVFSTILKVPQIKKITGSKSTEGLSFTSFFSELIMYTFSIGYNISVGNTFNLYGENVFIAIQNIVILFLFLQYDKVTSKAQMIGMLVFYVFTGVPLVAQLIPSFIYDYAMIINIFIVLLARIPQITINFKNGSTGQLAFASVFLSFAGAIARMGTVLTESADDLLSVIMVSESAILNGTLFTQCILYWNSSSTTKTEQKTKKD